MHQHMNREPPKRQVGRYDQLRKYDEEQKVEYLGHEG